MRDTRRRWLLKKLTSYEAFDEREASMLLRLTSFVMAHDDCFSRRLAAGHVVSSAWVVDRPRRKVLLLHHKKLGQWLQPGGHVENDPSLIDAARRELREETGLKKFRLLSGEIFDIDVHPIPAHGKEPEHLHYDVRFVFETAPGAAVRVSDESNEVRWVELERVAELHDAPSIRRMVEKTRRLA